MYNTLRPSLAFGCLHSQDRGLAAGIEDAILSYNAYQHSCYEENNTHLIGLVAADSLPLTLVAPDPDYRCWGAAFPTEAGNKYKEV